jgi:hypothetical protein
VVVGTINSFAGRPLRQHPRSDHRRHACVTEFKVGQDFRDDPSNTIGFEAWVDNFKADRDGDKSKASSRVDGIVYCSSSSLKMIGTGACSRVEPRGGDFGLLTTG